MIDSTRVILKTDPFTYNVDLFLGYQKGDVWVNITMDLAPDPDLPPHWPAMKIQEIPAGSILPPEPFVRLPMSCLKSLRDELGKLGIVSETDEHRAGELTATKAHLSDMRDLVFTGRGK